MENSNNFNNLYAKGPFAKDNPALWDKIAAEIDEEHNKKIDKMVKDINSKPVEERILIVEKIISIYVDRNKKFRFKQLDDFEKSIKQRNEELIKEYNEWLQELKETNEQPQVDFAPIQLPRKMEVLTIALLHVYWGRYDKRKQITSTNKEKYVQHYGVGGKNKLINAYRYFYEEVNSRITPKNDKRSINKIKSRFEIILPILEKNCRAAYEDARLHFEAFKVDYL